MMAEPEASTAPLGHMLAEQIRSQVLIRWRIPAFSLTKTPESSDSQSVRDGERCRRQRRCQRVITCLTATDDRKH